MIKFILNKAIDLIRLHYLIQMILSLAAKILFYNNFFLLFSLFLFLFFLLFLFPTFSGGRGHSTFSGGRGASPLPLGYGPGPEGGPVLCSAPGPSVNLLRHCFESFQINYCVICILYFTFVIKYILHNGLN